MRLGEYPHDFVEVACWRCERLTRLRRDELLAQHGADAWLPQLVEALANCQGRERPCPAVCGAYLPDCAAGCPKER